MCSIPPPGCCRSIACNECILQVPWLCVLYVPNCCRRPRSYQVCCLDDVSKLLKKHSRPQRKLDKRVHTGLQELKPSASAAGRLLARLEAAVMGHKGATSL